MTIIAKIAYSTGQEMWLEPAKAPGYFVRKYVGASGKAFGQRLKASNAARLLRAWSFAVEHNGAKLIESDGRAVCALVAAHPEAGE